MGQMGGASKMEGKVRGFVQEICFIYTLPLTLTSVQRWVDDVIRQQFCGFKNIYQRYIFDKARRPNDDVVELEL